MASGPYLRHRITASLFLKRAESVEPAPSFWWTALIHSPLVILADHAAFGKASRPSRQTAAKSFAVMGSSQIFRTHEMWSLVGRWTTQSLRWLPIVARASARRREDWTKRLDSIWLEVERNPRAQVLNDAVGAWPAPSCDNPSRLRGKLN
jgi:hypothetical protein